METVGINLDRVELNEFALSQLGRQLGDVMWYDWCTHSGHLQNPVNFLVFSRIFDSIGLNYYTQGTIPPSSIYGYDRISDLPKLDRTINFSDYYKNDFLVACSN